PILRDDELAPARGLVELLADGLLLDDVDELDASAEVRDDRLGVRVPTEQQVTRLDLLALLHGQGGAIGDRETAAHGPFLGAHHDLALAARDAALARRRRDERDAREGDLAVHLRLALRLRGGAGGRPAGADGPARGPAPRL